MAIKMQETGTCQRTIDGLCGGRFPWALNRTYEEYSDFRPSGFGYTACPTRNFFWFGLRCAVPVTYHKRDREDERGTCDWILSQEDLDSSPVFIESDVFCQTGLTKASMSSGGIDQNLTRFNLSLVESDLYSINRNLVSSNIFILKHGDIRYLRGGNMCGSLNIFTVRPILDFD